jgi:Rrf2 family transcriptional regulator, iron-sulfur cluster assembly transcription factor
MRFSLQAQYAICGLFDLAYNGRGEPIQVRVIGDRQGIPARYLEQIFNRLRRAGLVQGKRGPGGGYVLARAPDAITLRDVVEAVEGPAAGWLAPEPGGAPAAHRPDFLWPRLAERVAGALADTTLADLCADAAHAAVRRAELDLTYVI